MQACELQFPLVSLEWVVFTTELLPDRRPVKIDWHTTWQSIEGQENPTERKQEVAVDSQKSADPFAFALRNISIGESMEPRTSAGG